MAPNGSADIGKPLEGWMGGKYKHAHSEHATIFVRVHTEGLKVSALALTLYPIQPTVCQY